MAQILHKNSKGIAIVREDFKTRSQVKVISGSTEKHSCLRIYRFKLIHEPVEVPYCSWANLDCCGGWSYDEEYLDTAVQKNLKLFSGRTTHLKSEYFPNCPTAEEARRQFDTMKEVLPDGVLGGIEDTAEDARFLYTFLCRTGSISEYIDLGRVFGFYEKLGVHVSDMEQQEIRRLCDMEIRCYGTSHAPFQYTHAMTTAQLITAGLLLGYPIESTASILQGY